MSVQEASTRSSNVADVSVMAVGRVTTAVRIIFSPNVSHNLVLTSYFQPASEVATN